MSMESVVEVLSDDVKNNIIKLEEKYWGKAAASKNLDEIIKNLDENKEENFDAKPLSFWDKFFNVNKCISFLDYSKLKKAFKESIDNTYFFMYMYVSALKTIENTRKAYESLKNVKDEQINELIDKNNKLVEELNELKNKNVLDTKKVENVKVNEKQLSHTISGNQISHPLSGNFIHSLSESDKDELRKDMLAAYANDKRKTLTMERHIKRNGDAAVYPMFLTCLSRRNRLLKKWFERYDSFCVTKGGK